VSHAWPRHRAFPGLIAVRSAWESDRSKPLTGLTWATDIPLVTVTDLAIPVLMAC
jgi:hypothetical protein